MFTPQQTNASVNQAIAGGQQAAMSPQYFATPGVSGTSPALNAHRGVASANALAQGQSNAENIRLSDANANAQHQLASQQSRFGDIFGQMGYNAALDASYQSHGTEMGGIRAQGINANNAAQHNAGVAGINDQAWWNNYGLQQDQLGASNWFNQMGYQFDTQQAQYQYQMQMWQQMLQQQQWLQQFGLGPQYYGASQGMVF
jgi:hypothetical protein